MRDRNSKVVKIPYRREHTASAPLQKASTMKANRGSIQPPLHVSSIPNNKDQEITALFVV